MVTCTAAFIYDLKRQRSLQHFLTIEDLPEQFHTVVIPSGETSNQPRLGYVGSYKLYPEKIFISQKKFSQQQYLMRYLQPDKNVSMELCGNSSMLHNL